ncbi:MAG: efflux RND transporter periplasmic adaptor subunit [Ectothiorhodospiraceae bacterium]|nr:efflux RND transporter periplasmic adaptor subunit [Chromatiales bacterium]MCP5154040.1 efflux RND transporter periplasmic adaptor subunit [Ectothiorhodospiraceae bacterium]
MRRVILGLVGLGMVAAVAWVAHARLQEAASKPVRRGASLPVPVEVAVVERGSIAHRRTFSGTLAARAEMVVAAKVGGRLERLHVDLADTVTRGQAIAELDDDEHVQAVAQAEAERAVAEANLGEAQSLLDIAERELRRVEQLRARGVASESQRDAAKAEQLARRAHVEVTRAQLARAEAALEATRIRLRYTAVVAAWRGGGERRVVAERLVDEGDTVAANAPLLRIVELSPIVAVFHVAERDYAMLGVGQAVSLRTDAYPEAVFEGRIARVAPVFRENTRQARIEAEVDNADQRLKPGMFVRATVVLDRVDDAVIVPDQALVRRDERDGVFVLGEDGSTVHWRVVVPGHREDGRVQVRGEGITGRVVTLGQQLLDDGAVVSVSADRQVSRQ